MNNRKKRKICETKKLLIFILLFILIGVQPEGIEEFFIQRRFTMIIARDYNSVNYAITENGLLPYQLCGSNETNLGAGFVYSSFIHNGVEQLIAVTASSSWGEGARLPRIEFLAYFRPNDPKEWNCDGHCEILPRGAPIITPNVTCHMMQPGRHPRSGYFSIPAEENLKQLFVGGLFSVVNVMCPGLELDLPPSGQTRVELFIGDEGKRTLFLNICHIHVSSTRRVSLCTEPLFGIESNNTSSLAFWKGITTTWPRGYHNHTLLDAFLKYHINVLGLHVTVNAYLPDEFTPHIQKYLGPNFAYRPGWNLSGLGISNSYLNYEIFAVATCQWEHRLDSQWVMAISAPDNFIFPRSYGETLDDVLDRLDPSIFSGAEIPMMLSHSSNAKEDENKNVLQRWRILDNDDEPYYHDRSIPIVNPRHTTHTCIHWNHARTNDFKKNIVGRDVIDNVYLSIVHIMAITRMNMNKKFANEREDLQPWFDDLGLKLQNELDKL